MLNQFSINDNIITIHTAAPTLHRMNKIIGNLHKHYHKNMPVVHYLPASRYGVLQSHKILAAQIVKRARYIGLEEFHVPKMPGAITDFLGNLLEMPTREGSCKNIAKHLEENMLHGTIAIRGELPIEINYKYLKQTVPLHRVSSMVSEMAPLVLYLRHVVSDQSLLIIEEPESHLHPDNQIYLAKCIVELVRQGVYVLITTHSPYLVEEIGNYLKASKIPDKDRNKLLKCKDCYIKPNELAAYLFETKDGMSKIKNVKATADNGIDQNQFVEAFETISEHSRTIEEYHEPT